MDIFFWIVAVLLVGIGGFTGYMNWKGYFEARKAREQYLKSHSDARIVRLGRGRIWAYSIMLAACVGLAIMIFVMPASTPDLEQNRLSQGLVYVGLAVFSLAMLGEAAMDEEVVSTPDSFLYESDIIRFKNLRTVNIGKGMFKNSFLVLNQGKEIPVSKKTAMWVDAEHEDWKRTRKETFRSRKERRAAARKERKAG